MINFEKQFSNLLDYNPTTDSRLRTLRTQAFERFIKTGLPTKKWEEWQFTDFSVLNKEKFRINDEISEFYKLTVFVNVMIRFFFHSIQTNT